MKSKITLVLMLFALSLMAQGRIEQKTLEAIESKGKINIDGQLTEGAWVMAKSAKNFINFQPVPGEIPPEVTEVKVLYDDQALYIGAYLFDQNIGGLLREFSLRDDENANTDQFSVIIDTYQGQQNALVFAVMATGVQYDAQIFNASEDEDANWDGVWESDVYVDDNGWYVEMKIPYSALRFPKKDIQTWNINFIREIRRHRIECAWNPYTPNKGVVLQQMGVLEGVSDISPPTRLSFTPYVANVLENQTNSRNGSSSTWTNQIGGGLDVKYGINQAFTLDMTLVPDFSEVQSDDAVLNLGPFEVAFDENRPFFTEGTELFNKNDLFYSRRIGGRPLYFSQVRESLEDGESLVENPRLAQLINATKVSGRTERGTGIGIFNAIEGQTEAIVENEAGEKRSILTSPLSNYNVFIVDQQLKNGSNIYGMNTNVWRAGDIYDANVTALGTDLKNRKQSYSLTGFGALSQRYEKGQSDLGHAYQLAINKIAGNWMGGASMNIESDNYQINDLGLLFSANEKTYQLEVNYTDFDGFGNFARAGGGITTHYTRLYRPDVFADFAMVFNSFLLMRSFNAFGIEGRYEPVDTYDYFDPRTQDFSRYLLYPKNFMVLGFVSTDYRKTLALDARIGTRQFSPQDRFNMFYEVAPRIRFSDRFNLIAEVSYEELNHDRGFVRHQNDAIIMGDRDRTILVNTLNARYIFNANLGLALRVRHYWSKVKYLKYYELNEESELIETAYTGEDDEGNSLDNVSQSFFNLDCVLRWRFAPGSDLIFTWKTAITDADDFIVDSYWKESRSLIDAPIRNSFTLKALYFLDWSQISNWK